MECVHIITSYSYPDSVHESLKLKGKPSLINLVSSSGGGERVGQAFGRAKNLLFFLFFLPAVSENSRNSITSLVIFIINYSLIHSITMIK